MADAGLRPIREPAVAARDVGGAEPRSLADEAADRLRAAIQAGALAPGSRLVERRIAADLGISHIPVREALARLGEEGLIDRLPRRGARVATLTQRDLDEISTLRTVLEQFVVRRVQLAWGPAPEAELRAITTLMLEAAEDGDATRLASLDQAFHELLWRLSGHALVNELAAQFRRRVAGFLMRATLALSPDALREHADSHVRLVEAIASGDVARAEREMEQHIGTAAARIARALPEPRA